MFAAVVLTLLWHAGLVVWLSTLALRAREAAGASVPTQSVDIVFLPRRHEATPPVVVAPPARGSADAARSEAPTATPARADAPHGTEPAIAIDTGVEIVAGDDQWTPSSPPSPARGGDFLRPRNPLARDELDAPQRLRVRMRPPPSVEMWLEKLAPVGYEADPCPEIARAITGLAPDGASASRALLDEALAYQAKYCS
ncbi:hypothetical protein [Cognatilysobacter bugurensis]|uniref:hypothetical protein n=1 Tax=Cognatilysobacter bugurensis TaxID=543356 RepID=UPI00167A2E24|nr:hypothetical protein [Lysobacter bugurensis]